MKTITIVNGKAVGSGKWSKKAIELNCKRLNQKVERVSYQYYDIESGFSYDHINLDTWEPTHTSHSDPYRSMLGL